MNSTVTWEELCEEFEQAKNAKLKTVSLNTAHFAAVFKGHYNANPTLENLNAAKRAFEWMEDVRIRMKKFCKENS